MKGKSEKKKPGVVIYFDIRNALSRLTMEQRGILLTAVLDYAEYGEITDLDIPTGVCFDMLRPKIDYDDIKYGLTIAQRQYAAYVRETKKRFEEPIPYEEWLEQSDNDR